MSGLKALSYTVLFRSFESRGIKLKGLHGEDCNDEEEDEASAVGQELDSLFGRSSNSAASTARVFLDDYGTLHWPLLLMYPEYSQTDLISQANETTR